jgi:hypothetical protein
MPKKREIESLVFLICQNGVVEWINIVRSTHSVSISCIATCKSDIISRLSGFMIFLGSRIYSFKPIVKLVGGADLVCRTQFDSLRLRLKEGWNYLMSKLTSEPDYTVQWAGYWWWKQKQTKNLFFHF